MNLSLLKDVVLDLVQGHHDADGIGPDPYQPVPMRHAMAEGKFLASISELARTGVLSSQRAETMAAASLHRLGEIQSETEYGIAFGLGFDWKGIPNSTPFTITTAIVADGLDRVASVVREPEPFWKMAAATKDWLTSDDALDAASRLPNFSPGYPTVITNVVGFWAYVLRDSHPDFAVAGRRYVEAAYVPSVGWTYAPNEKRLDLLHVCYTARAVLDQPEKAHRVATAVSRFFTPTGLIDKIDMMSLAEADAAANRAIDALITIEETRAFLLHAVPARPWSIGELLTVCAGSPGDGTLDNFWRSVAVQSIKQLGSMDLVADGPRHTMHLAHGMASHLATARTLSR
jgi:hypothetical protein